MPRIRTLKPEHRQHRKVGKLSHLTYRLWIGMLLEADDEGRLICDPGQLRVIVFGYHPKVTTPLITSSLRELESAGLVQLYAVEGVDYAAFPSWHDHQKIDRARPSLLPAPSGDPADVNLDKYAETEASSKLRRSLDEASTGIRGGSEGIGRDQGSEGMGPVAAALVAPNGAQSHSGVQWNTPSSILRALDRAPRLGAVARLHAHREFWKAEILANPGVDLAREILKAEAYLAAHPEKRYRKLTQFLHGWFGRADRLEGENG